MAGKPGEVVAVGEKSVIVAAQGGSIELLKVRLEGMDKASASSFAADNDVMPGARLGVEARAPVRETEPA